MPPYTLHRATNFRYDGMLVAPRANLTLYITLHGAGCHSCMLHTRCPMLGRAAGCALARWFLISSSGSTALAPMPLSRRRACGMSHMGGAIHSDEHSLLGHRGIEYEGPCQDSSRLGLKRT